MNFINQLLENLKNTNSFLFFFQKKYLGADLADMQFISKCNKGVRFLLCVIGLFSKYDWVVPLKDKKGITIVNAFQSILDSSKRKTKQNMG